MRWPDMTSRCIAEPVGVKEHPTVWASTEPQRLVASAPIVELFESGQQLVRQLPVGVAVEGGHERAPGPRLGAAARLPGLGRGYLATKGRRNEDLDVSV